MVARTRYRNRRRLVSIANETLKTAEIVSESFYIPERKRRLRTRYSASQGIQDRRNERFGNDT